LWFGVVWVVVHEPFLLSNILLIVGALLGVWGSTWCLQAA